MRFRRGTAVFLFYRTFGKKKKTGPGRGRRIEHEGVTESWVVRPTGKMGMADGGYNGGKRMEEDGRSSWAEREWQEGAGGRQVRRVKAD